MCENESSWRSGILRIKFQNDELLSIWNKILKYDKNIDICLLELKEDVIEIGKSHNVLLRPICLPEEETVPGSSCVTSGVNRDSKIIDAVPLNLLDDSSCNDHYVYNHFGTTLNENQLCAGLPSNTNSTAPFNGKHQEDFGGPLICLDKTNQKPIFTGISSSNSLSTKNGQPGLIQISNTLTQID